MSSTDAPAAAVAAATDPDTTVPPAGASSAASATMKCIHVSALGDFNETLSMPAAVPRPTVDVSDGEMMLVRVEACSISPGDTVMLNGSCDKIMQPPEFPFIPGMDICGVVEEVVSTSDDFKVGDRVIATNGMMPIGGLAEYAAVHIKWTAKAPADLDPVKAATLPNSPVAAMHALKAAGVVEGQRVLILGGSGGVGSSLIQLAKDAKASYVATTSTDESLCSSLGADRVIDYRETNWYEEESFKADPFDVVIDCVGWRDEFKAAGANRVLKPGRKGGRFIVIATTDSPEMHSIWQGMKMFMPVLWRIAYTSIVRSKPRYSLVISAVAKDDLIKVVELVSAERLKTVLDPSSPFPFTLEGVKAAFALQASKHAHGKVVVSMLP